MAPFRTGLCLRSPDFVVCPTCGHEHDSGIARDSGSMATRCDGCDNTFEVEIDYVPVYCTYSTEESA